MKHFKTTLTILMMTLLGSINAFSQFIYPSQEDAKHVLSKTLAVELLNESNDDIKKQNEDLKSIFTSEWDKSKVEFFSTQKIQRLIAEKNTDYVYLTQELAKEIDSRTRLRHYDGSSATFNSNNEPYYSERYVAFSFSFYPFKVITFKNNKKGKLEQKEITSITFANPYLNKTDYLFLAQQLNKIIGDASEGKSANEYYGNVSENIEKIKNDTLLLAKPFFKEKEIKKIPSSYEYPFEILEPSIIDEKILNKTVGYTYIKIIWHDFSNVYVWAVIEADSGKILAQTAFGGVKFGRYHNANEIIKVKHLKYCTHEGGQKMNSRHYR